MLFCPLVGGISFPMDCRRFQAFTGHAGSPPPSHSHSSGYTWQIGNIVLSVGPKSECGRFHGRTRTPPDIIGRLEILSYLWEQKVNVGVCTAIVNLSMNRLVSR
jgi:hypothetical protein